MVFSESDTSGRFGEGENERLIIKKKDFVSGLGVDTSIFKNLVHTLALRNGMYFAKDLVVISDGAVWIKRLVDSLFPQATVILDWFHASQHLWDCAKEMYGEKSKKNEIWVSKYKKLLWEGKIDKVLNLILKEAKSAKTQTPLRKLYSYFNTRKNEMRYKNSGIKATILGSGAIESANKYVIQSRLKKEAGYCVWNEGKGANCLFCRFYEKEILIGPGNLGISACGRLKNSPFIWRIFL